MGRELTSHIHSILNPQAGRMGGMLALKLVGGMPLRGQVKTANLHGELQASLGYRVKIPSKRVGGKLARL